MKEKEIYTKNGRLVLIKGKIVLLFFL